MARWVLEHAVVLEGRKLSRAVCEHELFRRLHVGDLDVEVHLLRVCGVGPSGPHVVGRILEADLRYAPVFVDELVVADVDRRHVEQCAVHRPQLRTETVGPIAVVLRLVGRSRMADLDDADVLRHAANV